MILQQLYKDAPIILGDKFSIPNFYIEKPVRWEIDLDEQGYFRGYVSLGGGKENKRGLIRAVPDYKRTSGVYSFLYVDTPAYALGMRIANAKGESDAQDKINEKHAAFIERAAKCAEAVALPAASAVLKFLQSGQKIENPDIAKDDLIEFTVCGRRLVENPKVRDFWISIASEAAGIEGICLVTGRAALIPEMHPGSLKHLPGGQTSGVALISGNDEAYESYGFKRSQISPISIDASERIYRCLNALIEGERTHLTIGSLVYVFWTAQGPDDDVLSFVDEPNPGSVEKLLSSYRTGAQFTDFDEAQFHIFALSASGARAVIRDQLDMTIRESRIRLARWFTAQKIVAADGSSLPPLGLYKLVASLYRDARKEMETDIPRAFMQSALHGAPLPWTVLNRAVLRCRAEQRVTQPRAAVMKLWFEYQNEEISEMLDENNREPGYLCGRLFAELEAVQKRALGKTNTTLVDRYYGAASTAPITVFASLMNMTSKAYLPKLRKNNTGAYFSFQQRIEAIFSELRVFPATLPLKQQAFFALGFYHQRAENRAKAIESKRLKEAGKLADLDQSYLEDENTDLDEKE